MTESSASFAIRPCRADDISAIARIYRHAVATGTASFEIKPPSDDEMLRRLATLAAGGHPRLVATRGRHVVGYSYAGPYRPRRAYRDTVENSVYVAPAQQGQGLGRALMVALIDAAAAVGFRQMVAIIGDSANEASVGLHASLGFAHVGTLRAVGWKHGRWLDTVLMQRALGPGDAMGPAAPEAREA